ncbi:MAG: site-2 protease family protein [Armatimonadota bacterium]|nr:site-2 protease family protein [Armatimonadota bacterium]MDR7519531.1 site-2 protease family protein [Armatimonadota bacterium]MDR7548910.1 site-2 protease family protein [Armatimonadota bacterium]
MLRKGYRLPFRLLGIPIYLDPTFLIILPVLAWVIGSRLDLYIRLFRLPVDAAALQEGPTPYLLGLAAALGLFASVLIHELGHSVVGRGYGVQVKRITLWLLGGVAQFEEMPRQRGAEAVVAIAGPLTSLAVAAVCSLVAAVVPPGALAVRFVLGYLVFMNGALAAFNMLPALPLDGGRVLRSLLALRMPPLRATQIAAGISSAIAIMLGLVGFLTFNLFLILIAFFVYMTGSAETQNALVAEMLEGIGVEDLMTRDVQTVPAAMPIADLIQKMLRERHLGYPVVDDAGNLAGIVTLNDLQGADASTPVARVMSPTVATISVRGSALEAFEVMSRNNYGRLVVLGPGRQMVGIITKTDLIRAVQVRVVGLAIQPEPART